MDFKISLLVFGHICKLNETMLAIQRSRFYILWDLMQTGIRYWYSSEIKNIQFLFISKKYMYTYNYIQLNFVISKNILKTLRYPRIQDIKGKILLKMSGWDLQITSTYWSIYSRYQCLRYQFNCTCILDLHVHVT